MIDMIDRTCNNHLFGHDGVVVVVVVVVPHRGGQRGVDAMIGSVIFPRSILVNNL
jgi:hypothetical protein